MVIEQISPSINKMKLKFFSSSGCQFYTAREARHLVLLYERLGFRFVQQADWEQTNYTSIIMNKKLMNKKLVVAP